MIVAVTGVPGTGKTRLAKEISIRYGLKYVDVLSLIQKYGLGYDYDKVRDTFEVDVDELNKYLLEMKDVVIDSHLSHHLPFKFVDYCVVCRCSLKELKERLVLRGYNSLKVKENLEAEAFEVCKVEAEENGHKILDSSREDFFQMMDWLIE
jgi:adenylate kinase